MMRKRKGRKVCIFQFTSNVQYNFLLTLQPGVIVLSVVMLTTTRCTCFVMVRVMFQVIKLTQSNHVTLVRGVRIGGGKLDAGKERAELILIIHAIIIMLSTTDAGEVLDRASWSDGQGRAGRLSAMEGLCWSKVREERGRRCKRLQRTRGAKRARARTRQRQHRRQSRGISGVEILYICWAVFSPGIFNGYGVV